MVFNPSWQAMRDKRDLNYALWSQRNDHAYDSEAGQNTVRDMQAKTFGAAASGQSATEAKMNLFNRGLSAALNPAQPTVQQPDVLDSVLSTGPAPDRVAPYRTPRAAQYNQQVDAFKNNTQYFEKGTSRVKPKFKAKGSDVVPAMLTPGEGVLNEGAAEILGRDTIEELNEQGRKQGAKTSLRDGVLYAEGGVGYVDENGKFQRGLRNQWGFQAPNMAGVNQSLGSAAGNLGQGVWDATKSVGRGIKAAAPVAQTAVNAALVGKTLADSGQDLGETWANPKLDLVHKGAASLESLGNVAASGIIAKMPFIPGVAASFASDTHSLPGMSTYNRPITSLVGKANKFFGGDGSTALTRALESNAGEVTPRLPEPAVTAPVAAAPRVPQANVALEGTRPLERGVYDEGRTARNIGQADFMSDFINSGGKGNEVFNRRLVDKHGQATAFNDMGGGIAKVTMKDGHRLYTNVGVDNAVEGRKGGRWEDTPDYKAAVARAQSDKRHAAELTLADAMTQGMGLEHPDNRKAAIKAAATIREADRLDAQQAREQELGLRTALQYAQLGVQQQNANVNARRVANEEGRYAAEQAAKATEKGDAEWDKLVTNTGYKGQDQVDFRNFANFNYTMPTADGKSKTFADMTWNERHRAMPQIMDQFEMTRQANAKNIGRSGSSIAAFEPAKVRNMEMDDVAPGSVFGVELGKRLVGDEKNLGLGEYLGRKYLLDEWGGSPEVVESKDGRVLRKSDFRDAPGPFGSMDRKQGLRKLTEQ